MKRAHSTPVLALVPSAPGIGFAVIEGGVVLADWGLARLWAESDEEFIARVECLVDRYRPSIIVVEGYSNRYSEKRVRRVERIIELANAAGIRLIQVSRASVQATFENTGTTKQEIALTMAEAFPELKPHLPPPRKPWTSEDKRMTVFDAVALGFAALMPNQSGNLPDVPS